MLNDIKDVLMLGLMNPATLAAGFMLGRRADQIQKIVLAVVVAGVAGMLFAWALMLTGLFEPKIRLLGGVFVLSAALGTFWAWIGFVTRNRSGPPNDNADKPE